MAKRKLNIQVGEYDRRGVGLGKELIKKSKIMRHIIQYAQDESHGLDIQLRGGYMNIYYQGGNLVRLSEKGCWFDKNYLYLPEEKWASHDRHRKALSRELHRKSQRV